MATPPNIKEIRVEDYPQEMQDTISKLAYSLNDFMRQVIDIVDGNIDTNNLSRNIVRVTIKTGPDAGGGIGPVLNTPIQVSTGISSRRVIGVNLINWSGASLTTMPAIDWTPDDSLIKINSISDLPADSQITLTLELIPENN